MTGDPMRDTYRAMFASITALLHRDADNAALLQMDQRRDPIAITVAHSTIRDLVVMLAKEHDCDPADLLRSLIVSWESVHGRQP